MHHVWVLSVPRAKAFMDVYRMWRSTTRTRTPNGSLTGGELLGGYMCLPDSNRVSANSLSAMVYAVHDALCEYDSGLLAAVRVEELALS